MNCTATSERQRVTLLLRGLIARARTSLGVVCTFLLTSDVECSEGGIRSDLQGQTAELLTGPCRLALRRLRLRLHDGTPESGDSTGAAAAGLFTHSHNRPARHRSADWPTHSISPLRFVNHA